MKGVGFRKYPKTRNDPIKRDGKGCMLKAKTLKGTKIDVVYITNDLRITTTTKLIENQKDSVNWYRQIEDYTLEEIERFRTEPRKGACFLVCGYKIPGYPFTKKRILKRGTKKQCERHQTCIKRLQQLDYILTEYMPIMTFILAAATFIATIIGIIIAIIK